MSAAAATRAEPASGRGRGPVRAAGEHLPLHRLCQHRRGRRGRGGAARDDDHRRPAREDARARVRRAVDPAQGGQAPRAGARHVLRRRTAARDGLRPLRPLAVRPREDRLDRRLEGARARRRVRDAHGRRGRDPHGPVLRDVRGAGRLDQGLRARRRQGAAHGRAGRGRLRGDPRARARRGRPGRGRLRPAPRARRRGGVAEGRGRAPRRRGARTSSGRASSSGETSTRRLPRPTTS